MLDPLRVVHGFKQASDVKSLRLTLTQGLSALVAIEGVARGADKTLVAARLKSLSLKGRIWQSSVIKVMKSLDPLFAEIDKASGDLRYLPLKADPVLTQVAEKAMTALDVPKRAGVEYAIADIEFETNPSTNDDEITYDLVRLRTWISELKQWAEKSQSVLGRALKQLK